MRMSKGNMVMKKVSTFMLAGVLAIGMIGCASGDEVSSADKSQLASEQQSQDASEQQGQSDSSGKAYASEIDESAYDLEYSDRDNDPSFNESSATKITLENSSASVSGKGVTIDGSTATITSEGVYVLSGTLTNGQIVVNASEDAKVQLILKGASISSTDRPAVFVQQADKCFVTLADGTENKLADGAAYADAEADANAVLYAECDLTLQGSGQLTVSANYKDAIKTKDDLVITGGSYDIKAESDALVGHDSVKVSDGLFEIDAGNDGIKSSKDDDASKGFVSINGGTIKINAANKGINAVTYARVDKGTKLEITADDDAIHSDNYARILGGDIAISSGDDAVHAEYVLVIEDGMIDIKKCAEGYEAQVITVNGSTTNIIATDDGINAATGGTSSSENDVSNAMEGTSDSNGQIPESTQDGQGFPTPEGMPPDFSGERPEISEIPEGQIPENGAQEGNRPTPPNWGDQDKNTNDTNQMNSESQDNSTGEPWAMQGGFGGAGNPMMDADENCVLTINDGTITIDTGGDGVDSNGYIYLNGGCVYVSGPTNNGNGSLDYGLGAEATNGTLIAAGSAGMAEAFSGGSQGSALVNASGSAGETVQVKDTSGKVLAEFTPTKDFQCVVVSAPGMVEGSEYALKVNEEETTFTASTEGNSNGFGGLGKPSSTNSQAPKSKNRFDNQESGKSNQSEQDPTLDSSAEASVLV